MKGTADKRRKVRKQDKEEIEMNKREVIKRTRQKQRKEQISKQNYVKEHEKIEESLVDYVIKFKYNTN